MNIKLHITEVSSTEILWEAMVREEDIQRARSSPEEQADPHFIDRHREQLIQRVTVVDALLDKLYGPVLDEEQYQRIRAGATNQDKMRRLYDLMPSWDRACKDCLYRALKVQHKHLVAELSAVVSSPALVAASCADSCKPWEGASSMLGAEGGLGAE
ncbi:apoptosis-associated speck-like protein containing a CARD [Alligator mississippiensis]|uniref:apoptosis-associated speck-like protein containing a CARD n=1 Tax=Alligator mississippiensis TaxID=8496 RepID=UPI0003D0EFA5|nr:apoptosis-associated speck-like protein containing a CARD [Alligator mississippiensis]